jgi:predicted aspartyl protease
MGHISKDCRKSAKNVNFVTVEDNEKVEYVLTIGKEEQAILTVKGKINGVNVDKSLDTGATVSIISKRVIDENKIKLLPSETKIKTADN